MAIAIPLGLALMIGGCNSDIGITESSRCDGQQNPQEEYVDSAFDRDNDGYFDGNNPQCEETYDAEDLDCNDGDELVNPGAGEIPCNARDDDCNELTADDDGCSDVSFSGNWNFTPAVSQSCAMGLVNMSFTQFIVLHADPNLAFSASGNQPGTMSGGIDGTDSFTVSNTISGSCNETYTLTGQFTDDTHLTATFSSQFSGTCLGCTGRQWPIAATKMP